MFQLILVGLGAIIVIPGLIALMRKNNPANKTPPSVAMATIACGVALMAFAWFILPMLVNKR